MRKEFEEVANCAMECDFCYLPFRMVEQKLTPPAPEHLVECRCPECDHLVTTVLTEHMVVTASIH